MAGTVKKLSVFARPWGEAWQVWQRRKKDGAWELSERVGKAGPSWETLVAIPSRQVVTLAFWVDATEPETVKSIALLEVEMKGLASAERLASDVFIASLWSEGERTLVRATIFPVELTLPSDAPSGETYEPAPYVAALTGNTVHLWREGDDLVAVWVWRDQILCWETMHWPAEPREVRIWLRCLLLQFRTELQITERFALRQWVTVFDLVPEDFASDSGLTESDLREGPPIIAAATPSEWTPASTKLARKSRQQKELLTAVGLGVLFLALCSVAAALLLQWQVNRKIAARDSEIAVIGAEIDPLRISAARWIEIEAAADDRFFPIEMLHLIVNAMPPSGVRLTAFEMTPNSVLMEGEATQVSAAADYFQKLQETEAGRAGITWTMPPPSLQANNTARFVINGVRNNE